MKRDACIDFHLIPDRQLPIHKRLSEDWAAYCHGSKTVNVSAMFRLYRSDETWFRREAAPVGDTLKGAHLNAAVVQLPEPHRIALQWFYIVGGSPSRTRRALACTMAALCQYLSDGRNMLVNRGI